MGEVKRRGQWLEGGHYRRLPTTVYKQKSCYDPKDRLLPLSNNDKKDNKKDSR